MTSKEFEVMRKAQKHEIDIAVQRELSDVFAEIKLYEGDCVISETDKNCLDCTKRTFSSIYGILMKHMKEA